MNIVDQVIKYHRAGIGVIPLKPRGKTPIIEKWDIYQKRRPTEQEILAWWKEHPTANIGIITGLVSGIVVLDTDGEEALEALKGRYIPTTAVSKTGKGFHYIFRHPGGHGLANWAKKIPGCDFRGDGGYIVAPPSVHPSGAVYEWVVELESKDDLAEAPSWLIEICGAKNIVKAESPDDPDAWYVKAMKGVGEGERNDTAAKLAGRYLAMGMTTAETEAIISHWNAKNKPPIPTEELIRTINSIARREHTRQVSEQLVAGEEVTIDGMDVADRTDIILTALQEALGGIKVHRLIKYLSDKPVYVLETNSGTKTLGDVSNLTSQAKFRDRIVESEGLVLKPFKPGVWLQIVQNLLNICDEIEVAEEATEAGQTKNWLKDFLDMKEPYDDMKMAVDNKYSFRKDEDTYIFFKKFSQFISRVSTEKGMGERELAMRLKSIGASVVVTRFGNKTHRAWKLPELESDFEALP